MCDNWQTTDSIRNDLPADGFYEWSYFQLNSAEFYIEQEASSWAFKFCEKTFTVPGGATYHVGNGGKLVTRYMQDYRDDHHEVRSGTIDVEYPDSILMDPSNPDTYRSANDKALQRDKAAFLNKAIQRDKPIMRCLRCFHKQASRDDEKNSLNDLTAKELDVTKQWCTRMKEKKVTYDTACKDGGSFSQTDCEKMTDTGSECIKDARASGRAAQMERYARIRSMRRNLLSTWGDDTHEHDNSWGNMCSKMQTCMQESFWRNGNCDQITNSNACNGPARARAKLNNQVDGKEAKMLQWSREGSEIRRVYPTAAYGSGSAANSGFKAAQGRKEGSDGGGRR